MIKRSIGDISAIKYDDYFTEKDFEGIPSEELYIFNINKKNKRIPICGLIYLMKESEKLTVLFNGAVNRKKRDSMTFQRNTWIERIGTNVLILPDMTLSQGDFALGWGTGIAEEWYIESMSSLINNLIEHMKLKSKNIVLYGSSAGGFQAFLCGLMVSNVKVIMENPQTDVFRYYESHVNALVDACHDGNNEMQLKERYGERFSLIRAVKKYKRFPNLFYHQNKNDKKHYVQHYLPFIDSLTNLGIEKNNFIFEVIEGDDTHNPGGINHLLSLVKRFFLIEDEKEKEYERMRVTDLRYLLRQQNMSFSGKKSLLIQRLLENKYELKDLIGIKKGVNKKKYKKSENRLTVIILSWKRVDNIYKILQSYDNFEIVDEIIIWNNNRSISLNKTPKTTIINSSEDMGMRTRFAAGLFAKNECIIFHDDDTLLPQNTIKKLYSEWKKKPEIMHGLWGCIPKKNGTYSKYLEPPAKVDMIIGRCMVLKSQYCRDFFQIEKSHPAPIDHSVLNGCEDILMSYMIMKITGKKNQCHSFEYVGLPYNNAISRRPNHYNQRTEFMQRCQNWLNEI
jgi:hypothetical protein